MSDLSPERQHDILEQRPASVGAMLLEQVKASGDREAFRFRRGDHWESLSWNDVGDRYWEILQDACQRFARR